MIRYVLVLLIISTFLGQTLSSDIVRLSKCGVVLPKNQTVLLPKNRTENLCKRVIPEETKRGHIVILRLETVVIPSQCNSCAGELRILGKEYHCQPYLKEKACWIYRNASDNCTSTNYENCSQIRFFNWSDLKDPTVISYLSTHAKHQNATTTCGTHSTSAESQNFTIRYEPVNCSSTGNLEDDQTIYTTLDYPMTALIYGAIVCAVLLITVVLFGTAVWCCRRLKKRNSTGSNEEDNREQTGRIHIYNNDFGVPENEGYDLPNNPKVYENVFDVQEEYENYREDNVYEQAGN